MVKDEQIINRKHKDRRTLRNKKKACIRKNKRIVGKMIVTKD